MENNTRFKPVNEIAASVGENFIPISKLTVGDIETICEEHIQTAYLYMTDTKRNHTSKGLARIFKRPEEWADRLLGTQTYKKMLEDKWKISLQCSDTTVVGVIPGNDPLSRATAVLGVAGGTKRYRRSDR